MKRNKILSLFLALIILFSSVPVGAIDLDKINESLIVETLEEATSKEAIIEEKNNEETENPLEEDEKSLEKNEDEKKIGDSEEVISDKESETRKSDLVNNDESSKKLSVDAISENNEDIANKSDNTSTENILPGKETEKSNESLEIDSENVEESKKLELDDLEERIKLLSKQLAEDTGKSNEDLDVIIDRIAEYYKNTDDDWAALTLTKLNKFDYINETAIIAKAKNIAENSNISTDFERITISLTALGYDVTEFPLNDGKVINLIEKIANFDKGKYGTGLGTLNGYIFALLAYDSGQYEVPKDARWTREAVVKYILENQHSDGGWSLDNSGDSDVDMTAAALQALANYKDTPGVNEAIEKALDFLSSKQIDWGKFIGSFGPGDIGNANSTAWVILALENLKIDYKNDSRFIKTNSQGKSFNAIDGLLSFKTRDNLFGYKDANSANEMATSQAFQALTSHKTGKNIYLSDKPTKTLVEKITPVKLTITTKPKSEYLVGEKADTTRLTAEVTFSDKTTKTLSSEKLNTFGLDTTTSGRKLVYVEYEGLRDSFWIEVKERSKPNPIPDPIPNPNPLPTPNPNPNPLPDVTRKPKAYVSVIVPPGANIHQSGWRMKEKTEYEIIPGTDTAFSMLQKTGLNYNYNYHKQYEGVYVNSIEGLSEFDGGPNSGWMYRVNGVFPSHSASVHKIYDGDYVEWLYTRDLGKDLGGYVPGVEKGVVKESKVTIRNSIGGSLSPSGRLTITKDKPFNISIKADVGYELVDVLLNNKSLGAKNSVYLTLDNTPNDSILEAVFRKIEPKKIDEKKQDPKIDTKKEERKLTEKEVKVKEEYIDTKGHWAEEYIEYVTTKGYFYGVGDNKFNPNGEMTRAMFVTVLGRMDGVIAKSMPLSFNDVNGNAYYAAYVDWAVKNNITSGVGDNNFAPDRAITREEMAKLIDSYLNYKNTKLPENSLKEIKDINTVSEWAKDSVIKMYKAGILEGTPEGNFNPKNSTTRAEISKVVFNIDKIK